MGPFARAVYSLRSRPAWHAEEIETLASEAARPATEDAAHAADARRAPPHPARGSTYTYVFDLTRFEEGKLTATRALHLSARPRQTWVCVARDDEHALALAKRAALVEWAEPSTRRPEDFTVRFLAPFATEP